SIVRSPLRSGKQPEHRFQKPDSLFLHFLYLHWLRRLHNRCSSPERLGYQPRSDRISLLHGIYPLSSPNPPDEPRSVRSHNCPSFLHQMFLLSTPIPSRCSVTG